MKKALLLPLYYALRCREVKVIARKRQGQGSSPRLLDSKAFTTTLCCHLNFWLYLVLYTTIYINGDTPLRLSHSCVACCIPGISECIGVTKINIVIFLTLGSCLVREADHCEWGSLCSGKCTWVEVLVKRYQIAMGLEDGDEGASSKEGFTNKRWAVP